MCDKLFVLAVPTCFSFAPKVTVYENMEFSRLEVELSYNHLQKGQEATQLLFKILPIIL